MCGNNLVFFKLKIKKAINFRHQSSISEKPKDPLLEKTSSGPETLSVAMMERPGGCDGYRFPPYHCLYCVPHHMGRHSTFHVVFKIRLNFFPQLSTHRLQM
ncbi:UNVERIFIED_CONTAM: hypothetical protein K2H54_054955 [Gekko kuhli]